MSKIVLCSIALVFGAFATSVLASNSDFSGPSIIVLSHENGQIVNTKKIVLSGTASDAGRGNNGILAVYARGRTDRGSAVGGETASWSQGVDLNPGANRIEVRAYDNSANQNYTAQEITINFQPVDSLPPSITVTSHTHGQTVNTKEITISGTATDAGNGNSGISSVYLRGTIAGATATGAGTATWSQTVTLNPGANYLEVYAYDASDVQNSRTFPLTINFQPLDALGPNLVVTSHSNGQTVGTSTITLTGTASDAGRGDNGISSVYARGTIPGAIATGAQTVNWTRNIDLSPGPNYVTVWAYDASDVQNVTTVEMTINFQPADALPPLLAITSHTNGQTVFSSSITISGTATDAGRGDRGISSVYLRGKIPGAEAEGSAVVNWSQAVELTPGRNFISVSASDRNEFPNQSSETLTINFQPGDTLGPNLTIASHFDGQVVGERTVTIRGTATDAGRGDNGISAVYSGGKLPDVSGTGGDLVQWSRTVELNPGENWIFVTAYDNSPFPNETSQSIRLVFRPADALPPSLVVTSHAEGQVVGTNVVTVSGTASDAGRGDNGVASVKVNFVRAENDTAAGSGVAQWSRTFALTPGNNNIYITATDNSEFHPETNLTLRLVYAVGDVTPPSLSIDSPRNNATVSTSTVTISGTATDNGTGGSGIASVSLNGVVIPGSAAAGSDGVNWSQTVNLQRGANVIALVATDNSGRQNAATATITVHYEPVDTLPPNLSIDSHKNNQVVTTASVKLAGTASDNGLGGSGIESVLIDGLRGENDSAAGSLTANWARTVALQPGANVISVVARDGSPQRNAAALSITLIYDPTDSAGPNVEITSHRKDQTVPTATIILAGTASDAGRGDNGVGSVTVNGETATGGVASGAGSAQWSRQLTLNLGPNLISVVGTDLSGNTSAQTIRVVYEPEDKTAPQLEVTSHKNGQTVGSATVVLAGIATDADRGDSGIQSVSVNGGLASGGKATGAGKAVWNRTIELVRGENVISVVAVDTKGNSSALTLTLEYDPLLAQAGGAFCWARNGGGSGSDAAYAVALDREGNSYVTGSFEGSALFGGTNLVSEGASDIFLAKYDSQGTLLWARQAGSPAADAAFALTVSSNGNCFVTGYYSSGARFGSATLTTTGTFDMFLAKYDPSGRLLWVANTGRGTGLTGNGVAVDADESCYVAGSFVYDAYFGSARLENNEYYDAFVTKFDPEGRMVWVNQLGGETEDRSAAIALDSAGHLYVTGYFDGEAWFDEETLISDGEQDSFLCQLDTDGYVQWARQIGGPQTAQAYGLAVDRAGHAYVSGYYKGVATFETNTLATDSFFDVFLAKYDGDGEVVWVRNAPGSYAVNGTGVGVDGDGNVYLAGSFVGPANFGSLALTNDASGDLFITKYDTAGAVVWVRSAGGELATDAFALAVSPSGTVFVAGSGSGRALFGGAELLSNSGADMFLAKLSDGVSAVEPRLEIRTLNPSGVQIEFSADSCANYRLQGSTNLVDWNTLLSTNSPAGPVTRVESRDSPYKFYRVVSP